MKTKDYIIIGTLLLLFSFSQNYFNKSESMSDFLTMLVENEKAHSDSLRKKDLQIFGLRNVKKESVQNYNYQDKRAEKFLSESKNISSEDTANCLPIINSLFECEDILFDYQKSSKRLNLVNDSLIFELDEKIKLQNELMKIKDQKFNNAPQKSSLYLTLSGSVKENVINEISVGAFYSTKKRFAFGYQYGLINKTHEAKVGMLLFRHK